MTVHVALTVPQPFPSSRLSPTSDNYSSVSSIRDHEGCCRLNATGENLRRHHWTSRTAQITMLYNNHFPNGIGNPQFRRLNMRLAVSISIERCIQANGPQDPIDLISSLVARSGRDRSAFKFQRSKFSTCRLRQTYPQADTIKKRAADLDPT